MTPPRIYFADLEAYNAGQLKGVWVEFYQGIEPEDVWFALDAMLRRSRGEEWEIHDSEGFAGFDSNDIELLCQVANLIHEHGKAAVRGFIGHVGKNDVAAEIDNFNDIYLGCHKSEADFCEKHLGDEGGIHAAAEQIQVFDWATLDQFIDWEAIAGDAFINLYYSHAEGYEQVHVYLRQ